MIDLFNPIVPENKQHKNFKLVNLHNGYSAAKKVLNEVYNSIKPIDKDFIQQFQTIGFDSRIWELYLAATFTDIDFTIERNYDRPDFELKKENHRIFVEAVTSNTSFNKEFEDKLSIINNLQEDKWSEFIDGLTKESIIRVASALYNKLKERYYELEWVKNQALILAIEPFHHSFAHWLSDNYLITYLYGINSTSYYDNENNLQVNTHIIQEHSYGNKVIPSNFFSLEGAENISAVIFSNSGTISKFNRIGKLKGYGDESTRMLRYGNQYDHNPNAAIPIPFVYEVGVSGPKETWAQGISMFHNPNALNPIDKNLFPDMLHGYYDNKFYAYVPKFYPFQSETIIIT